MIVPEFKSARRPVTAHAAAIAAASLLLTVSTASSASDAEEQALLEHRERWQAAAVADYEYGYNKYCECHRDAPPETLVTVRDGEVVRVRHRPFGYEHEVEAEQRNLEWYWTVEGLFDLVRSALERGVEVRADYDPALGFPTHVFIDYDPNMIGEELDVRLTRLEPLVD
jgi:hypothetical protein